MGKTIFPSAQIFLQNSCLSWLIWFTCNVAPPHLENDEKQTAKLKKLLNYFSTIRTSVEDNTMKPVGNLNGSFFTCSVPIPKCGKS